MLNYVDVQGNPVSEREARLGVAQVCAILEHINDLLTFIKDTSDLTDEMKERFDNELKDLNNTLDYCMPANEEIRIDPETYAKLQTLSQNMMTIFGTKDESYYYQKGLEYASEHRDEANELAETLLEVAAKYDSDEA